MDSATDLSKTPRECFQAEPGYCSKGRAAGVIIPGGRCPTVAVSGLTLGGGFGFSSRKLGLTCDSLVESQVVLADGSILTCNASENADLFWAIRGGGEGSFGINTSFTFRVHPVGDVSVFNLEWDASKAQALLDSLRSCSV